MVNPLSTSRSFSFVPAVPSVIQQMLPSGVWLFSGWVMMPESLTTCCGFMRVQCPLVALSVGSPAIHPDSVSMVSLNAVTNWFVVVLNGAFGAWGGNVWI